MSLKDISKKEKSFLNKNSIERVLFFKQLQQNNNKEQHELHSISYDSSLIESRFPKLIYAYKKFFKHLDKILKEKDNTQLSTNVNENDIFISSRSEDLFVEANAHSLEKYEKSILQVSKFYFLLISKIL